MVDYIDDAVNRRIVKKKNGTPYAGDLYGSGSRIAAVLDSSGNLAARFVYASHPNTPDFMVLADGSVYRFLCDQLGSPRLIVNSTTGAVAQKISYDPFGTATLQTSGPFPAWQQPFGFAGGLYDEDTGLVRFGARDYDPEVGRWLARDPILFKGGQTNLYVCAGDDPVNRIDPSGLWGFAFGPCGEIGISYLTGLWGLGGGIYVDVTGGSVGFYGTGAFSAGVGAAASISPELSAFTDSSSFRGLGIGGELDTLKGGVSITTPPGSPGSGYTVSVTGPMGPGAAVFAGGTVTYTPTWELFSWKHKSPGAPASSPKPCPLK